MYDFLKSVPLLDKLPDEDLRRLCEIGREVRLPAGSVLFAEGDAGDMTYIIREGEIEITKITDNRQIVLAIRGAGEVIGEISLLENARRMAGARAVSDSVLFAIKHEDMDRLLRASPSAAYEMLRTIAGRLKATDGLLRQSERLALLGTLAAGIAHELNNPAAAVLRGADHLRAALELLRTSQAAMPWTDTPDNRYREIERLVDRIRDRSAGAGDGDPVDSLGSFDRENEIEAWLEDRGFTDMAGDAGEIASLGYGVQELEELRVTLSDALFRRVVVYLRAVHSAYTLADEITRGARQISGIIHAMRGYVYQDQAPVQDVDIHQGIENTLIIMRGKLKPRIQVHREYSDDLPRVHAYGSELNQVWTNLIDNAVEALGEQGNLRLRTLSDNAMVIVEVEDDGPGIPEAVQPMLFSPFFTTKPVGEGTGLGLNISLNIIRKHGGTIEVTSRPGRTVFSVRLPVDFTRTRDDRSKERDEHRLV
jgi:signal transduction histidine kinase